MRAELVAALAVATVVTTSVIACGNAANSEASAPTFVSAPLVDASAYAADDASRAATSAVPTSADEPLPSTASYAEALARLKTPNGQMSKSDLSDAQLAAPLRNATFVDACGAPRTMRVTLQLAVRFGRAAGVTVTTSPPDDAVAACIDRKVRALTWPSTPLLDTMITRY